MFNKLEKGMRVELANGSKATITSVGARTFFAKPDGGTFRDREYSRVDGTTVDKTYNVKAILPTENLNAVIKHDFRDGKGSVDARYFINAGGDKGGIVALTAFVDADSRIGIGSTVGGTAQVINSVLKNNASLGGNAVVKNTVLDGAAIAGRVA